MPYTTVATGTTITASWANANVRDQVVTPFSSASSRDSSITAPVAGMLCYLRDVDQMWFYEGSRWAPAAGTILARGNRTSSSSTTTSEVGVLRLTTDVKSGQIILVMTSPLRLNTNTSGDYIFARLRYTTDGSTPSTSSTVLNTVSGGAGLGQAAIPIVTKYVAGSDLVFSVLLTVGRSAGTGTVGLLVDSVNPEIDLFVVAAGTTVTDAGVDI